MKQLMIFALSVSLIIGVVSTGGCALNKIDNQTQETPTQILNTINPEQAFTLIQDNKNNPDFVILDVRTPEEFADGYIENAINLDFYSEVFRDELDKLDKDETYLIYCRSGNRSGRTLPIMEELGFRKVHNMHGGIVEWQAKGLPTTK
jgi:rhodanese-related sulfurtransferase